MVAAAREYTVDRRVFYLYRHRHRVWPEESFLPRLDAFEEHFVASNAQADLLAHTHQDFRWMMHEASYGLASGAVAFCLYVGREVAHVGWLATTAKGRSALDWLGYAVHFDEGEAWTGAARTVPAYRNKGLLTYSCRRRFEYLLDSGCEVSRAAVEMNNVASHVGTMRFEPQVYAIGLEWRAFGRRWWSERPVKPSDGV